MNELFRKKLLTVNSSIWSFFLILFITYPANAQFNHGSLVSDHFYTEIPFEYVHDHLVIEASINGVKGRYLLDTGAMCILFKDSTEFQFENTHEMNIGDASGKKQKAQMVQMPLIEVGDLQYENIPTLYVDMFEGPFKCLDYKGIIGSNLLRFGAFKIDWEKQKLIIAESYQVLGEVKERGFKMHVNKQQSSPYIKTHINDKNIKLVLLDTGSSDGFSLYEPTAEWLTKKEALGEAAYVSTGTNSHGAWGAGEYQRSVFDNLDIQIGNTKLSDVSVETSGGKSKIGMKIFEKGNFVFDYPQKRFFLELKKEQQPILIESFGLDLIMENDQFVINGIWKGTQAEDAGLAKGDVVVGIEGFNLENKSTCEVFLTLRKLTRDRDELIFYIQKPDVKESRAVTLSRIKI